MFFHFIKFPLLCLNVCWVFIKFQIHHSFLTWLWTCWGRIFSADAERNRQNMMRILFCSVFFFVRCCGKSLIFHFILEISFSLFSLSFPFYFVDFLFASWKLKSLPRTFFFFHLRTWNFLIFSFSCWELKSSTPSQQKIIWKLLTLILKMFLFLGEKRENPDNSPCCCESNNSRPQQCIFFEEKFQFSFLCYCYLLLCFLSFFTYYFSLHIAF